MKPTQKKLPQECPEIPYIDVDDIDVREELAKLGVNLPPLIYKFIQAFLTWMTGKPYRGQTPLFRSSKEYELATALLSLFGGATVSCWILNSSPWLYFLLPIPFIVTVGGARKTLTCIVHRCVHYQFFKDNKHRKICYSANRILAEILSTIILVQGFDDYQYDHVKCHHHRDKFATFEGDPDAKFMLSLGFHPGLGENFD